jgi:hypothetical protein
MPARGLPRSPSGGGAGASSRARTGGRRCRGCRRTPAPRCGGAGTYFSISTWSSPKRGGRLALARGERFGKFLGAVHQPHSLAAAAGHGLDQHGIADLVGRVGQRPAILVPRPCSPASPARRPCHQRLGRVLQAHRADATASARPRSGRRITARRRRRFPKGSRSPDGSPRAPVALRGGDDLLADKIAFRVGAGPISTASSASRTWAAPGVGVGIDRDGLGCPCGARWRMMRRAISPRLANEELDLIMAITS